MKRFVFPLERVLDWRRMQASLERLRREQCRAELAAVDAARAQLRAERERSSARVFQSTAVTGADLAALNRFCEYTDREQARLARKRVEAEKRVMEQTAVVAAREREVKILEHLRERRLKAWEAGCERETEQVASEAFLARWGRGVGESD